jgi:hypothetical protein
MLFKLLVVSDLIIIWALLLYFLRAVISFCIVSGIIYPNNFIVKVPLTTLLVLSVISIIVEYESIEVLNLKRSGSPQYESEA